MFTGGHNNGDGQGNAEVVGVEVKASGSRFLNSARPSCRLFRHGRSVSDNLAPIKLLSSSMNADGDRFYPKVE